jgi:O-acetyl-ADP-ribose deacetylase (regulator of RNase III)
MKYVQGNLIDLFKQGEFDLIAHQCNCKGQMGAGIAKQLSNEFNINKVPASWQISIDLFGKIEEFDTPHGKIVNMYSQFSPGACHLKGIDSFQIRIGALRECLRQIKENYSGKKIGFPLIASGLAKKKSNLDDLSYFNAFILPSVKKCLRDMKVTIVYL